MEKGIYQTLFLKLLGAIQDNEEVSKSLGAQLNLIKLAINNMSEGQAESLARHIKQLAKMIENYESTSVKPESI